MHYQGVARSSEHDARERLHQDGSDPALDSFVARLDDEVVGFAHVWPGGEGEVKCFCRTRPDTRGRGVAAALLERCERRAGELPAMRMTTTSWAHDEDGPALLEQRGYRALRYFLQMRLDADALDDAPVSWPEGVGVRLFAPGADDDALFDAWSRAFAEHFGVGGESATAWWRERRESKESFDPTLWFLAVEDGAVAGFSLCEELGAVGRVAEIGVPPPGRGRGIAYALLRHSLLQLRARGASQLVLDVDAENLTGALGLYRKAGMQAHPSFTIWERRFE